MIKRDYIETWSGKELWLPFADDEAICIEDIAHALCMVPRFAGHIDNFYSVAEHSINVARLLPDGLKLQGLLHDATEAYLCDIPTPFKRMIPQYKELEDNLWATISAKYNVPYELDPQVKDADRIMLMTERDALKSNTKKTWSEDYESTPRWADFKPLNIPPIELYYLFIRDFIKYGGIDDSSVG